MFFFHFCQAEAFRESSIFVRGEEQVALVLVLAVPTWHVISLKERRQEWSDSKCVCVFWFGDDDVARRRALLCVCKCDA